MLLRVVRHGLAAAGRYIQLQVLLDDRPGALARMLEVIATTRGNIMHIDHDRTDVGLAIGEAWVRMQVETKGPEHCDELSRTCAPRATASSAATAARPASDEMREVAPPRRLGGATSRFSAPVVRPGPSTRVRRSGVPR